MISSYRVLKSKNPFIPILVLFLSLLLVGKSCARPISSNTDTEITFRVDEVEPATKPHPTISGANLIREAFSGHLAWSGGEDEKFLLVDDSSLPVTGEHHLRLDKSFHFNTFATGVHIAHSQHRSLVISPDMIWLLILQGFAIHRQITVPVARNRIPVIARGGDIDPANPHADWPRTIEQLTKELSKREEVREFNFLLPAFSTTGTNERLAMQVAMLSAFRNSFSYEYYAVCGIPTIKLTGTVEDWDKIVVLAEKLRAYDLAWWIDELLPVLKQFSRARRGDVDPAFWQDIYKQQGDYTVYGLNGWILKLFPYLAQPKTITQDDVDSDRRVVTRPKEAYIRNHFCKSKTDSNSESHCMVSLEEIPTDIAFIDLTVFRQSTGQRMSVRIGAGLIGLQTIDNGKTIVSQFGWVVQKR